MAPLSVFRGGAILEIQQYAARLMQKQFKVMASEVTLVNLDMKEEVVKSINLEQACHEISRICKERIHSLHTVDFKLPQNTGNSAIVFQTSSCKTQSVYALYTYSCYCMTHLLEKKMCTSYSFFFIHVQVYNIYCTCHDFSLRPHDIGVIELYLRELDV